MCGILLLGIYRGGLMEFIENLEKQEYEEFVQKNKHNHFMQSYFFGEIRKDKGFIPHYVGLKDKGKLICSALLLEKKLILGYSYLYSPRGYVIDFDDKELVKEFTLKLKEYAKRITLYLLKLTLELNYTTLIKTEMF